MGFRWIMGEWGGRDRRRGGFVSCCSKGVFCGFLPEKMFPALFRACLEKMIPYPQSRKLMTFLAARIFLSWYDYRSGFCSRIPVVLFETQKLERSGSRPSSSIVWARRASVSVRPLVLNAEARPGPFVVRIIGERRRVLTQEEHPRMLADGMPELVHTCNFVEINLRFNSTSASMHPIPDPVCFACLAYPFEIHLILGGDVARPQPPTLQRCFDCSEQLALSSCRSREIAGTAHLRGDGGDSSLFWP